MCVLLGALRPPMTNALDSTNTFSVGAYSKDARNPHAQVPYGQTEAGTVLRLLVEGL